MCTGSEPIGQNPASQPGLRTSQLPHNLGLARDQVSQLVPCQQAQPLKCPGCPLHMPGRPLSLRLS